MSGVPSHDLTGGSVKPSGFQYHRPDSLDEAIDVVGRHGSEAAVLAGGQSLVPLLAMRRIRPPHVVDLQRVSELTSILRTDGVVRIGAMVCHRQLERDRAAPGLMRRAARHIGSPEIRNRGTLGGSLAFADPAAEWPAVCVAMNAVLEVASRRGRRQIPARDFFVGPHRTSLASDELLVEVRVPAGGLPSGFAEATRRGLGDFALAGAVCHGPVVVVFGAGGRPQRLVAVEAAVSAGVAEDALLRTAKAEVEAVSEYKRTVAATLAVRVVDEARSHDE
jgi:carbon-monoxide dehydrogenase medium subunit